MTTDTNGNPIDSGSLQYHVYGRLKNFGSFHKIHTTSGTSFRSEQPDGRCFETYVTAFRTDTAMESAPSNTIEFCTSGVITDEPDYTPSHPKPTVVRVEVTPG